MSDHFELYLFEPHCELEVAFHVKVYILVVESLSFLFFLLSDFFRSLI